MRPFEYIRPSTIGEALVQLGQDGAIRPLAGGTDLLTLMKADIVAPERLIDIKRLPGLEGSVEETADGLTLGALATLSELETHPLIKERYPLLAEAAALAATPQLRNMATLGGNLLQRPRCWYYRNALFNCWLKGGEECFAADGENQLHALFGDGPCYAVHPSDIAPVLSALDAEVRLIGPSGERNLPIDQFFALPVDERRTETVLGSDEIVLSVRIPALPRGTRGTYLKAMDRKIWSFALVSVAALLRTHSDGRVEDARLVLGGVAPLPWRVQAAEQALIGAEPGEAAFARAAEAALADAEPLRENRYKIPLAKSLIRRALAMLVE